ncbi:MAG: FAD-dependent thymidylate synthase [Patescibacteria group bacterium]|jgi:thymidylate synthase ThyX
MGSIETNDREIFAITGLAPEVLAVGMAKYSRSQASIKETIAELTEEKSAEFHEKWVLGYGDASVADMAVVALACENVSILASKAIEDHRLASYQEKSTRYVSFERQALPDGTKLPRRYYRPVPIMSSVHTGLYEDTCEKMFDAYNDLTDLMQEFYKNKYPLIADMTEKGYTAKLKARSLDIARYVLPASTLTNLGWITSARSLRRAIFKMKQNDLDEIRQIAHEVEEAATEPAHNPQALKVDEFLKEGEQNPDPKIQELMAKIRASINLQVKGAPTLIKYTDPTPYNREARHRMQELAIKYLGDLHVLADEARVKFHPSQNLEIDLATTLLYEVTHFSFGQIREVIESLSPAERQEIIEAATTDRGDHDVVGRAFEAGGLIFDTLMDFGAFRDLQRHRICTQIHQPLTLEHGFESPPMPMGLEEAGGLDIFETICQQVAASYRILSADFPQEASYILPLATKKRTLFFMNPRELTHMVELRSRSGGHLSYRYIVEEMYNQVKAIYPNLAKHIRISEIDFAKDFYKR